MIGAALVAALALASQLQTHPTGLPSIGPSRANSLRTAPIKDKLYEQAGKPALDFNFARFKDLHDDATGKTSLVTFSRSAAQSPGTYVGSDGLIKTAAVNLFLYSEQFNNPAWTTTGSVTANQILAPDGKQTADLYSVSGSNYIGRLINTSTTKSYTASFYMKAASPNTWARIGYQSSVLYAAFFDLNAGVAGVVNGAGNSSKIEPIGGGWYRCSLTLGSGVGSTQNLFVSLSDGDGVYTASGNEKIYIWGAQLEETDPATMAPTPYIKTTSQTLAAPRFDHDPVTGESLGLLVEEARTNLITYSEQFDQSPWSAGGIVVTADDAVAPDGTETGDLLLATSNDRRMERFDITTTAGNTYTISAWLKRKTGTGAVRFYAHSFGFSPDLNITSEWARYTWTFTAATTAALLRIPHISTSGDEVWAWGAQLEQGGTFPTSYIPTTSSAQTRYADVAAVQDEDFSTTNLMAYSESFDVGWGGNATVTPNSAAAPNGSSGADKISELNSTTFHYVAPLAGSVPTTISGQTYTVSVFAKQNGRDFQIGFGTGDVAGDPHINYDLQNGVLGSSNGSISGTIADAGNGWYRCTATIVSAVTGASFDPVFTIVTSPSASRRQSYTGDGTSGLYLWGASLTQTEYPVEYTTTRNLLTDSQDFERSTWKTGSVKIYSYDAAAAPDGTISAMEMTGLSYVYRQEPVLANALYVSSIYVKTAGANTVRLYSQIEGNGAYRNFVFDLSTGTVASNTFSTAPQVQDAGNGWYRISIAETGTTTATRNTIYMDIPSGTGSVLLWGGQFEPGTTVTDYVRTVDVIGKDYGWYEPTEGTVFVEADTVGTAAVQTIVAFHTSATSTTSRTFETRFLANGDGGILYTVTPIIGYQTAMTTQYQGKIAAAEKYNSARSAFDGSLSTAVSPFTMPAPIGHMSIGSYTNNYLNGHIRRLAYWPRRQADSTLQVITQ